jgi:hypothetical protein
LELWYSVVIIGVISVAVSSFELSALPLSSLLLYRWLSFAVSVVTIGIIAIGVITIGVALLVSLLVSLCWYRCVSVVRIIGAPNEDLTFHNDVNPATSALSDSIPTLNEPLHNSRSTDSLTMITHRHQ